jgi:hypothetical protein
MTTADDAARDTAKARADALLAMHARLEAVTAERDELAAKVARVEALLDVWDTHDPLGDALAPVLGVEDWDESGADLVDRCGDAVGGVIRAALRGNP